MQMRGSWPRVLALSACASCGNAVSAPEPGVGASATTALDAGPPAPVYAHAEGRFAPIHPGARVDPAMADATDLRLATASWPVEGTVRFRTTPEGVDLSVMLRECRKPYAYPVFIYPGADCSQLDARSTPWDGTRGTLSSKAFCFGSAGALYDSRPSSSNLPWTIGGPASSNVLGRSVAIHDPDTNLPLACARIELADDGALARAPDPSARPAERVTAQLAGLCVLGPGAFAQSAGPGACPKLDTLADCALDHCVAGCLEVCADYVRCLGAQSSACSAECPPSPECASCLGASAQCTLGFCRSELACAPPPTPGGPCSALRACCARQGPLVESCNRYADLMEELSGDPSCLGALSDWDVNTHFTYRSPCYPQPK